ncbi:MAG: LysM peptidoglycan-binding domain-containing protein [Chitinophagaceae bacterium]|nr:LysM peptidoglycan-binding domain-containing protein [Chitinophagaceae bacterium]MCW5904858.1 LysM peptidoglycan-binding domain-containing protein [Chitinophagaceae bacterium]
MKHTLLFLLSLFFYVHISAQEKIIVQGTYPNIFVQHKVAKGETLYSISRLYNYTPSQLAKQNGMSENDVLSVDKILKIGLAKNNFTQDGQGAEDEVLIPIYYIVQRGETLFRISQNFGKIRIDFLREWNNITNDAVRVEQRIAIGHLKVDKKNANIVLDRIINEATEDNTIVKNEPEPQPQPTVTTKEEPEPTPITTSNDDEGFFVTSYAVNGNNLNIKTGTAATFKSTSGWTDRKYYVLINDIPAGTIVRITTNNNRSICAKVLGALPEMKENKNLLLRLSNAGAAVLRITDAKFDVKVSYAK